MNETVKKRHKYAALFVVYNPTEKELLNIIRTSSFYDISYIYDNTEYKIDYIKMLENTGIRYFGYGRNDGLSIAYNFIVKKALSEQVNWLSIYDQDSIISQEMVICLKQFAENTADQSIACLVPYVQYGNEIPTHAETRKISWAINSGQMLNIQNISKKGLCFDENLFLDRVDKDFCKQIELAKMTIIQVGGALLKQKLGEEYNGYIVHSALRNYYIQKNRLYYNHKYYGGVLGSIISLVQTIKHIINILKSKKDIKENIYMMREGCRDYSLGNFGKKDT